jgi:uncharacterized protein (DUF697 family)
MHTAAIQAIHQLITAPLIPQKHSREFAAVALAMLTLTVIPFLTVMIVVPMIQATMLMVTKYVHMMTTAQQSPTQTRLIQMLMALGMRVPL